MVLACYLCSSLIPVKEWSGMGSGLQPSVVVLGGINLDLVTITSRSPGPGETVVGSRFLTCPSGELGVTRFLMGPLVAQKRL